MSAGPIRQWREAHLPVRVSSTNAERICYKNLLTDRAYCGRKPKEAYDDWGKVTCSDCIAARRADEDSE